jgi:2-polyprenyl-3-methyl-5-hydroxy-6-metoxy-1,4-benzoquinol methylase
VSIDDKEQFEISTYSVPDCLLCRSHGELLYSGLKDRLFSAPGVWRTVRCSNSECGVLWLDPMPENVDIVKLYHGYYTHHNSMQCLSDNIVRRIYEYIKKLYLAKRYGYGHLQSCAETVLASLMYLYPPGRADLDLKVFFLPAQAGARLLEVGCGSGEMLQWLGERGWQVEGLDFDPQALQNAIAKNLKVYLGNLESQGLPSNSYDAIVMNHVIEHVPNPVALMQECYRLLKPGGTLVSVTPNNRSLGHSIFKSSWFHLDPPRHLLLFTPSALKNMAESIFSGSPKVFSTIRGANGPMAASICIEKTGRYSMCDKPPTLIRIVGKFFQFIEWGMMFFNPLIGEEIILIAGKENGQ